MNWKTYGSGKVHRKNFEENEVWGGVENYSHDIYPDGVFVGSIRCAHGVATIFGVPTYENGSVMSWLLTFSTVIDGQNVFQTFERTEKPTQTGSRRMAIKWIRSLSQ